MCPPTKTVEEHVKSKRNIYLEPSHVLCIFKRNRNAMARFNAVYHRRYNNIDVRSVRSYYQINTYI